MENLAGFHSWRVAYYFCDATKKLDDKKMKKLEQEALKNYRPKSIAILRSWIAQIALRPDFCISGRVNQKYIDCHSTTRCQEELSVEGWKKLFCEVLDEAPNEGTPSFKFVFMVDGLDELEDDSEEEMDDEDMNVEKFLEFLNDTMKSRPNVYFLCSSSLHVRVKRWFGRERLNELLITKKATESDVMVFVTKELEQRRRIIGTDSAFCKSSQ